MTGARADRSLAARTRDGITRGQRTGHARGVDLFLKEDLGLFGLTGRLAYSFIDSERTDPDSGELAPSPLDATHTLNIVVTRGFGEWPETGAAYRAATGTPLTPVREGVFDHGRGVWKPVFGPPMSERLPDYSRLGLSAYAPRGFQPGNLTVFFVSVMNVQDAANIGDYRYSEDYAERISLDTPFPRTFYFGVATTLPFRTRIKEPDMSRRHILMTGLRPPSLRGLAAALAAAALVPAGGLSAQDRAHATADRMRSEIHRATIAGNDTAFADIVLFARRAVAAFSEDALINHYLGYALYRVATRTLGDDTELALEMLEESETHLQRSIGIEPIAESHALLAVVLGMRIVDDETAMNLGMRSRVEMQKARQLDPANPRVRLLEGISAFHAPEVWGGGHESALVHFLAAADLFAEDHPDPPLPNWGLAETHAWLGRTHAALGDVEEARGAYERALEEEPGYAWVRDTLLPGLARGQDPATDSQ